MRKQLKLYTHEGIFHADDVFATALLSLICEDYEVVRGNDENVPEDSDWIVFDIGGGELDHHTVECKERNGNHPNTDIPYAACGLVWRKYYKEILEAQQCPEEYYDQVYSRMETSLFLGIDAADNGYNPLKEALAKMPQIPDAQKHELMSLKQGFTISQVISDFNPNWESETSHDDAFKDAVSFATDILLNRLDNIISALDARSFILRNIDYSSNHIMVLDTFAPWQGIVKSESKYNHKAQDLWYVVSPALRGGYNVQCVLEDPDDRTSYRHPLPQSWYGLRDEELKKETGVQEARFCHPGGFLIGADSFEAAMTLAGIAAQKG